MMHNVLSRNLPASRSAHRRQHDFLAAAMCIDLILQY